MPARSTKPIRGVELRAGTVEEALIAAVGAYRRAAKEAQSPAFWLEVQEQTETALGIWRAWRDAEALRRMRAAGCSWIADAIEQGAWLEFGAWGRPTLTTFDAIIDEIPPEPATPETRAQLDRTVAALTGPRSALGPVHRLGAVVASVGRLAALGAVVASCRGLNDALTER